MTSAPKPLFVSFKDQDGTPVIVNLDQIVSISMITVHNSPALTLVNGTIMLDESTARQLVKQLGAFPLPE